MLFMGAAMSITAFPMLARIIYERGLTGTSLGTLALVLRECFEKEIDGPERDALARTRPQLQNAARDAQGRVGRDHVNVVGLHPEVVRHLVHRHRGGTGEQLSERAVMLGIEVLHQHKSEASVSWEMPQQLRECLQTACRSADSHDGATRCAPRGGGARCRASGGPTDGRGRGNGWFFPGWLHARFGKGGRACVAVLNRRENDPSAEPD